MKSSNDPAPSTELQNSILSPNMPIEELLGSVTTYNNVEGSDNKSQQLRTSARVFKKMKMDSAVSVAPLTPDKKESPPVKEEPKPEVKKRPMWSPEDKSLFFEALNEFGKDFDSLQNYISNKQKKRGLPESSFKTKDQIRHVYYRTWHKISKHLKFSSDIKKVAQELYALINYGELRKKIGAVSEKNCIKLNKLIYTGSVAIRRKGKTIRIRTPMCRALRKLNQLDETHDDIKLPARVLVELRPKDMDSFTRVQMCAQNPRLRTYMPLQKRLSCLISSATEKWKTQFAANYDKSLAAVNNFTMSCLPDSTTLEECKALLNPPIRLAPPPDAKIELPTFNLTEYLTCQSICLNSYEERIGVKIPGEQLWQWVWGKTTSRRGTKRARHESTSERSGVPKVADSVEVNTNHNEAGEAEAAFNNAIDQAVDTLLTVTKQENEEKPQETKSNEQKEAENVEKRQKEIDRIRRGWTLEDCGTVSVGELYLMFGTDGKLVLEYSWDKVKPKLETIETETEVTKFEGDNDVEEENPPNDLNFALRRLLSVAKLHYRKNMIKCPCGHVCGGPAKNPPTPKQKAAVGKKNSDMCDRSTQFPEVTKERMVQPKASMVSTFVPISAYPQVRQYSPSILLQKSSSVKSSLEVFQRLRPRFCSRRGRPRAKQVVVERKLPLLANKADSGHQIVQMNIISRENLEPITQPAHVMEITSGETSVAGNDATIVASGTPAVFASIVECSSSMPMKPPVDVTDNAVMSSSRVSSPTNISNLLDIALGEQNQTQQIVNNKHDSGIPSFVGLLSENTQNSTPPPSPTRLLKENENQWLNSEVPDFSLSSFLGHLESPMKTTSSLSVAGDESRMSQDVDAQLQSLLMESSIDYTAKFADLAAQVVSENKNQ